MASHIHVYVSFTHFDNINDAREFCVNLIHTHRGYGYTMIDILDDKHSNIIESKIIGSDIDQVLVNKVIGDSFNEKRT